MVSAYFGESEVVDIGIVKHITESLVFASEFLAELAPLER